MHLDVRFFKVERLEKWKAHQMVPVGVRKNKIEVILKSENILVLINLFGIAMNSYQLSKVKSDKLLSLNINLHDNNRLSS